jgi:hypothetical protein
MVAVACSVAAPLAHAHEDYPVANVPDIMGACRASDPLDCPVPPGEKWQAMYRERCFAAPEQCTFRPDGSIMRWVDKYTPSPQLAAAVRAVRMSIEQNSGRGRRMGPR